jgi:hypothetical protein
MSSFGRTWFYLDVKNKCKFLQNALTFRGNRHLQNIHTLITSQQLRILETYDVIKLSDQQFSVY